MPGPGIPSDPPAEGGVGCGVDVFAPAATITGPGGRSRLLQHPANGRASLTPEVDACKAPASE